ncbi:MAG: response regulator transcription factor [Oscillospiraceae bacterium]|nr:response regulator transcription factor [Oscillospiraceae bacterium]
MKQTIYVVEDDMALQELYTYTLETEFDCLCFSDGTSFLKALKDKLPDLVVLDIMLPDNDGFEILTQLKSEKVTANIPVIMVSAKGEEISKVKGLNMGAEDYIAKPFGVLELVARIKANLRKNTKATAQYIIFKDVIIDLSKHQIIANDVQMQATLKEYNLLHLLSENAEKVLERETIFSEVWGDSFYGETRTLDIHIKELRRKLAEAGSEATIKTIRGVGYMLI